MDKLDYISCRCMIDFADNPNINFLSFYYDEELEISVEREKAKIKDIILSQYNLRLVGDIEKAKFALLIPEVILLFIINILLSLIQSVFTVGGFFTFGADYWKYMLYQLTFMSTMIGAFYSLFWSIFSRKKQLNYYGRISHTINSIRLQKCAFESAKRSVLAILENSYIYGDNDCFQKLPFGKDYLKMLKTSVSSTKTISQYEYEYNKTLSSISNRGSMLFAIVGVVLSVLIQVFAFLDTWSNVGNEFHTNMIVTTVLMTITIPSILFAFISRFYHKRIMELESLYCLYSYQYLDMPYSEKSSSFTFDFSKYKDCDVLINEDFVLNFMKTFNKSILYKVSIRDIKIDDNYIISVFGFPTNASESKYFKETVTMVYKELDAIYLKPNN